MKKNGINRKASISVLAAVLTVGVAGTVVAASSSNSASQNAANVIGIQRAETIALQKIQGGTVESVELDQKRGKLYYEVDVNRQNGSDVDVHIDAISGAVVRMVNDDDADVAPDKPSNNNGSSAAQNKLKVKTVEQAISIAKTAVKGTVTDVERERDNGRIQYEVELRFNGGEATVEIDAATGKVVKVDKDYADYNDDNDHD